MITLKLGKPLKSTPNEPLGIFLGFDRMTQLQRRVRSPRPAVITGLIAGGTILFLSVFGGAHLRSMADPFAHRAKHAYTRAVNTLERFIPLHGEGSTANNPAPDYQYVQTGQPVMLKADHNN